MSDLIRSMMGMRRGPIGLPNNPSPFRIAMPEDMNTELSPEAEMQNRLNAMDNNRQQVSHDMMRMMLEGAPSFGESLKNYQERKPQQRSMPMLGADQMMMPGVRGAGY